MTTPTSPWRWRRASSPDHARPVEAAQAAALPPRPADPQAGRVRPRHLHLRPAADPRLPGRRPRADQGRSGLPRARPGVADRVLVHLLAADPLGARRRPPAHLAPADVPDPDEHQGAVEHRPGGQRGQLGPRLPADDAVRRHRSRRRLRAGHGRVGVGRRPQPDLLDRPPRVDPVPRGQPAVRHGRPGRPRDHARRRRDRGRAAARSGPRREVPALARAQAALRRRHRHERPAPDRTAVGGADRRPLAAQAGGPVGDPQLAARRGVAVGLRVGVRRGPGHRRPADRVRARQHLRRHPDHARAASGSSRASTSRPSSASA